MIFIKNPNSSIVEIWIDLKLMTLFIVLFSGKIIIYSDNDNIKTVVNLVDFISVKV